ncbi:hypothetical protein EV182_001164, partial [Spiromyces aspiralis]
MTLTEPKIDGYSLVPEEVSPKSAAEPVHVNEPQAADKPIAVDAPTVPDAADGTTAGSAKPAIPEPAPAPRVNVWLARKQAAATTAVMASAAPKDESANLNDPQSWPDPAAASAVAESKKSAELTSHKDEHPTESSGSVAGKKKTKGKWIPIEADIKYTRPTDSGSNSARQSEVGGRKAGGPRKSNPNGARRRSPGHGSLADPLQKPDEAAT